VGPQPDVRFYGEHVVGAAPSVLLLGCGTGRLALALCGPERLVVGVDASPRMLAHAEERRLALSPEHRAKVRFLTSDLRSLRMNERFDVILAPHNGLSLLPSDADLAAVFATVHHHLRPEGTFAFDVMNAAGIPGMALPHRRPFTPHLREKQRQAAKGTSGDGIRRWKVRQLLSEELDALLIREGFKVTERFGGFDGHPFSESDPMQVVVCSP
jgi:SAM-dependent methyltransferase